MQTAEPITSVTPAAGWYLDGVAFGELDYREARDACYVTPAGMLITPEWLLEIATRASARHDELYVHYPQARFIWSATSCASCPSTPSTWPPGWRRRG